jgi:hypothetical protein
MNHMQYQSNTHAAESTARPQSSVPPFPANAAPADGDETLRPADAVETLSPEARAGWLQVAGIVLSGLFMIGRRKTWSGEGARVSPLQIVAGALIGGAVLIAALLMLVRTVLALAGQ